MKRHWFTTLTSLTLAAPLFLVGCGQGTQTPEPNQIQSPEDALNEAESREGEILGDVDPSKEAKPAEEEQGEGEKAEEKPSEKPVEGSGSSE